MITFFCGAYPTVSTMPTPNECRIVPVVDELLHENNLRMVMRAVVDSWDPDWGRVSTFEMDKAINPQVYTGVDVGWLTYLSDRYGKLPRLPAEYQVTRIEGLGNLITITGIDRITASNPAHVAAVQQLWEILIAAGLLPPTPSVINR